MFTKDKTENPDSIEFITVEEQRDESDQSCDVSELVNDEDDNDQTDASDDTEDNADAEYNSGEIVGETWSIMVLNTSMLSCRFARPFATTFRKRQMQAYCKMDR